MSTYAPIELPFDVPVIELRPVAAELGEGVVGGVYRNVVVIGDTFHRNGGNIVAAPVWPKRTSTVPGLRTVCGLEAMHGSDFRRTSTPAATAAGAPCPHCFPSTTTNAQEAPR